MLRVEQQYSFLQFSYLINQKMVACCSNDICTICMNPTNRFIFHDLIYSLVWHCFVLCISFACSLGEKKTLKNEKCTGKSLSEALIFTSTNLQYDHRLFIELQVLYMKNPSWNLGRTCCVQELFLTFGTILVHKMFSPCSAKRRASEKDLPVLWKKIPTRLSSIECIPKAVAE